MVINRNLPFLAAGDGTLVCSAGKVVVIIWADLFHRISLLIFYSILMVTDFYPGCKKRIFYFVLGGGKYCIYKKRRMRYDDRDGMGSCCLGRREQ